MKINVKKMTEEQAKELLQTIIDKLDELNEDDFFGTEGWEHMFGLED
jgi:hypothetical protein